MGAINGIVQLTSYYLTWAEFEVMNRGSTKIDTLWYIYYSERKINWNAKRI